MASWTIAGADVNQIAPILTGLHNCITRPDLNSRTVMLMLQSVKEKQRQTEAEFWTKFKAAHH
jgi:hypothetical protein